MKKVFVLTIISVLLTLAALWFYRWFMGFVFAADAGWLRFFVR